MSSVPPGDPNDQRPSRPWGENSANPSSKEEGSSPARKSRMVGTVVDPALSNDALGLKGPGAPRNTFADVETTHPVRARLLERARAAKNHGEEEAEEVPSAPLPPMIESPSPAWAQEPSEVVDTESLHAPDSPRFEPPLNAHEQESSSPLSEGAAPLPAPAPAEELLPLAPTPPPAAVAHELERIAQRPLKKSSVSRLSPNATTLLGGIVSITLISAFGFVLGQSKSEVAGLTAEASPSPPIGKKAPEPKKKEKVDAQREKVAGPWRISDDIGKPGRKVYKGKIGKLAFLKAIQEAGLPKNQAYRAYAALKNLKDLDHCKSSDTFLALVRGSEKTLVAFEYMVTKEEVYQAKTNKEGRLTGKKLDLKVERNQIRRAFLHDGKSFEQSARRSGFDPGISSIAEVSLRGHSALRDFKKGDRLRVIAQEVTVLGEFSRYSGIEAMEINRVGEDPRRIYYYPHPIEGGHFDKNGRAPYEGGWRKPIPTAPVTSKFNMKRMHPVLNRVMPHTGTDFGAASGTPIGATAPGVISFRGPGGASGNLVKIKHDGGYESGYAHLSRFGNLHVGDKVERLQTIGYCGSTGRSTGPHLHFTMKKDGKYIDAESLSLDGLRVLPKAHRNEFAEVRSKYDPILDSIPLPALAPIEPPAPALAPETPSAKAPAGAMMLEPTGTLPSTAPPAPLPAEAKTSGPAKPTEPAKSIAPSAIFLSDAELLRMQGASDDGEVEN